MQLEILYNTKIFIKKEGKSTAIRMGYGTFQQVPENCTRAITIIAIGILYC
jgi:hypothetical protein